MDEPADEPAFDAADVFGVDDAMPDQPPADAVPADVPVDPAGVQDPLGPPPDPAVLAIQEWAPKTPRDLLRAIAILIDLDAADAAKPYADELGQQQLDQTAKADLVAQTNPADLMRLARHPVVGPVLAPLVDDWLKAAEAHRQDAARLTEAAGQLADPNAAVHEPAAVTLLQARESAVAPLVAVLADPNRAAEHAAAKQLLRYLDGYAVEPLLGVLESPDTALKTHVVELLGQVGGQESVGALLAALVAPSSPPELSSAAAGALQRILGRTPDRQEAVRMLEQAALAPLESSRDDSPYTAEPAIVWHWSKESNQSVPVAYDKTSAALARATRLARALHLVDPSRADWRRLYLTAMLQAAQVRRGLGAPLSTGEGTAHNVAAFYGPEVINHVLARALVEGYLPAAIGAAHVLGDIGNVAMLSRNGAEPSPLAEAAGHEDQRLRFAAINAIMKLGPRDPFAGSTNVTNGMGYFARSIGVPRVLVAHPSSAEAQKIAGMAATLGYETDIATNGRSAFELAVRSPDYDFLLLHSALDGPEVDYLVAQLRRDARTSRLPIGLMAEPDDMERVELFASRTPPAVPMLSPANDAEMRVRAGQLLARAGRWHVPAAERKAYAMAALRWLAILAVHPQTAFDVRTQEGAATAALYLAELSPLAAAVLGEMGTATSQQSLVELADLETQPLASRQAAANALARSVSQFGLRLTRDEIHRQYDLYNANAGRNGDTHNVLTAVLDAIEQKGGPAGGQ